MKSIFHKLYWLTRRQRRASRMDPVIALRSE